MTAVLLLALGSPAPGCGGRNGIEPAFDRETVERLEEAVREALERDGIPGALVGVWAPGRGEWAAALGTADRETGEPMRKTCRMRIGSVTKSFTATLALVLTDEGLLGLEDEIAGFFPWLENSEGITVRMLLNHTSGLTDDYRNPAFWDIASTDPLYRWEPEELARASLGADPAAAPGAECNYSNINYLLLGMIAEKVTGMRLAEAMEKHLFLPLGLADTVFPDGPEMAGEHSRSYIRLGEDGEFYDITSGIDPSITWAAGAMVSSLEDMGVWARALASGELLRESTRQERLRWVGMPGREGAGVGYEYGLGVLKIGEFVGHNGEFSGYQATVFHLPAEDASFVVLLNSSANPSGSQEVFTLIAAALFPDYVPEDWRRGI